MKIEYISTGDIQLEINNHREVLHPSRNDGEGNPIAESNVSGKPQIVQDIFNAMKTLPREGLHRKILFSTTDAEINVDGRTLTPDSDISGENAEVQAFFNAIYSHDDCCIAECYRLCKECEAGDVPVTETEEYTEENIEIVDGKAVKTIVTKTREVPVYDEYPLVDENDDPILDDEGNPVVHRVQRVIALTQEKKDRLCLLEDKISTLHSA